MYEADAGERLFQAISAETTAVKNRRAKYTMKNSRDADCACDV